MIISSCNMKGGTGKSTTAQNIAVYYSVVLNKKVLLVDADPQMTSTDWIQERRDNIKVNHELFSVQMSGNIRVDLLEFEKNNDVVVVDCGGHDSEAMRSALSVSTHAILPFRPKRRDLKKLPEMSEIIKMAVALNPNLQVNALITQCPHLPSQIKRILDAKDACNSFDLKTLDSVIYTRNIYDDSDENGSSVLEQNVDEKAKNEFLAMIQEFIKE